MFNDFLTLLGLTLQDIPASILPLIYIIVSVLAISLIHTLVGSLLYLCGWRN